MQSDFKEKILNLEKIFNIQSLNQEIFIKALTHSSFTRENDINSLNNYERLEFLGDAVLKMCISDILYKKFPSYSEGDLTKIRSIVVSDNTLFQISKKTGLDSLIIVGKQEEKMGGRNRPSILACVFEAVLGAYYLEGKLNEISNFLEKNLEDFIKDVDEHFEKFNAKAILQEYTQSQNKEIPNYKIVEEIGPQHNKIFVVEVSYKDEILASGKGKTKREAEQACAYQACIKIGAIK
jgi:ribonuclease-3